jgi:hypothetical protein
MPLYKKLIFFGIGIALGSLMVAFLFGGRDIQCAYFPNDRVLYDFRKKSLSLHESAVQQANQFGLDSLDLQDMLRSSVVHFKRSHPRKEPCGQYLLEWHKPTGTNDHSGRFEIQLENCDSTLRVLDIVSIDK